MFVQDAHVFLSNKKKTGRTNDLMTKHKTYWISFETSEPWHENILHICENKGADQLCSNCEADQRLFCNARIVQYLFFLNLKFPASSHLLCLYGPVCVGPVWKPHCWFSHEAAHTFHLSTCFSLATFIIYIKVSLTTQSSKWKL